LNRQTFEVTTLNYETDRKIIESIITQVEWGLHDKSALEIGEPSKYMGWTFFTVSIDVAFIAKMTEVYASFLNAEGWTYYEKFENWLNAKLDEVGSKARIKTVEPEFTGLF
jgi:phage FluMu gp28-like protein